MPVKFVRGDLFEAPTEALVNTVNTVGVMGKGLALEFKRRYPDNYRSYVRACARGEVQIGRIFVHDRGPFAGHPRYILNFPTKRHWRERSRIEYVREGLKDLKRVLRSLGIRSVAVPPLGAGLGRLPWEKVRAEIESALGDVEDVEVWVYEPLTELHSNPR